MTTTVQIEERVVDVQVSESPVTVDVQAAEVTVATVEAVVEVTPTEKVVDVTVNEDGDVLVTVTDVGTVVVVPVEAAVEVTVEAPVVVVSPVEETVLVTVEERIVEVELGLCVQTVASPGFLQTRIAGTAIAFGEIVTVNAANLLVPADPAFAGDIWEAIGAANAAYTAGQGAGFYSYQGRATRVLFDVIPTAADNGKIVYLGSVGRASLSAPPVLSGNAIVKLGVLSGADGVTQTPELFLIVQHIDPDQFTKRFALGLSHRGRVQSSGGQYLFAGDVATSLVPITFPDDIILEGASFRVERADPNDYELRIVVGGAVEEVVALAAGQTFASASNFATFVASGDDVQAFVARTTGAGASVFCSITAVLTYRGT